MLLCNLCFGVAALGDRLPAQALNPLPLAIRDNEHALRLGHLDARQCHQALTCLHAIAKRNVTRCNLRRDSGGYARGTVRVDDHLAGYANSLFQRPWRYGIQYDASAALFFRGKLNGAAFLLAVIIVVIFLGMHRGDQCETQTHRPKLQGVHRYVLRCWFGGVHW